MSNLLKHANRLELATPLEIPYPHIAVGNPEVAVGNDLPNLGYSKIDEEKDENKTR